MISEEMIQKLAEMKLNAMAATLREGGCATDGAALHGGGDWALPSRSRPAAQRERSSPEPPSAERQAEIIEFATVSGDRSSSTGVPREISDARN
ncbi:hypothetical protein WMF38_26045 [Sorangium sp. So ce118]